jgi:multisubunit Na+/H+ antiporter MnhB subunit
LLKSLFKVIRVFLITIIGIFFSGCVFNLVSKISNHYYSDSFISTNNLDNDIFSDRYKFITVLEFIFVSMSTVGYGDLIAINNYEKVATMFIVLFGISLDSVLIGTFHEILCSLYQ